MGSCHKEEAQFAPWAFERRYGFTREHLSINKDHDERQALFNERLRGPAHAIPLPTQGITTLHGILLDLDASRLAPRNDLFPPDDDPRRFFDNIKSVLDRHPLARHVQIGNSGTGLHAIIRLDPAVELGTKRCTT